MTATRALPPHTRDRHDVLKPSDGGLEPRRRRDANGREWRPREHFRETALRMNMTTYSDPAGLWRGELQEWMPASVFDAHVHLCPPEAMGTIPEERRRDALTTFDHFTWEEYMDSARQLFSGKRTIGLFAFPLPLREVDRAVANDYIVQIMRRDVRVHGFLLADPVNPAPSIAAYERAVDAGVHFTGVKPYFDLLGKSNFETTMPEFIPEGLLEFMEAERLVLMLHTSGIGVGDEQNRAYLRRLCARFPKITVILAHMGRYLRAEQCFEFLESGLLEDCPRLFADLSSVSIPEVYERFLAREALWSRLLFASDMPFGLITGVERWSETHGPIFLSRDDYTWSDPVMQKRYAEERRRLTYNTYHCIRALKEGVERLGINGQELNDLKRAVFRENATHGILGAQHRPTQSLSPGSD